MTPLKCDDPRLTEYVLGEMNDADRAAFEKQLESSPELRAEVQELGETAALLSEGFSNQTHLALNEERKAAVLAGHSAPEPIGPIRPLGHPFPGKNRVAGEAPGKPIRGGGGGGFFRLLAYGAVAACLMLGLGIVLKDELFPPTHDSVRTMDPGSEVDGISDALTETEVAGGGATPALPPIAPKEAPGDLYALNEGPPEQLGIAAAKPAPPAADRNVGELRDRVPGPGATSEPAPDRSRNFGPTRGSTPLEKMKSGAARGQLSREEARDESEADLEIKKMAVAASGQGRSDGTSAGPPDAAAPAATPAPSAALPESPANDSLSPAGTLASEGFGVAGGDRAAKRQDKATDAAVERPGRSEERELAPPAAAARRALATSNSGVESVNPEGEIGLGRGVEAPSAPSVEGQLASRRSLRKADGISETVVEGEESAGRHAGKSLPGARFVPSSPEPLPREKEGGLPEPNSATSDAPGQTDRFEPLIDNPFYATEDRHLSTFSIDVDTASYAIARRYLNAGQLPPRDSVRVEEFINYFQYDYPQPAGGQPFSVSIEMAESPWNAKNRLVRIGLKGREIDQDKRPRLNLVFLVDVSGSMRADDKLLLLKKSMNFLIDRLTEDDRVSIVTYAGGSGVALEPTDGSERELIRARLNDLAAGGSTNGSGGITTAYELAHKHFDPNGVNRVILATDGDFNVGVTGREALLELAADKARTGVFLTVLGFGAGNLKDDITEGIANKGNGNYFYIDSLEEGRKVLGEELTGTMITIAKDVKIQVAFNPLKVARHRLIGYANRVLEDRDFRNDRIDAGEIGGGHTVTAFYEVTPRGEGDPAELFRQVAAKVEEDNRVISDEDRALMATDNSLELRVRYKQPDAETAGEFTVGKVDDWKPWSMSTGDFRFAAAVAGFGMELRQSPHKGGLTMAGVEELAREGIGNDESGRRKEFLQLVGRAIELMKASAPQSETSPGERVPQSDQAPPTEAEQGPE